MNKLIRYSKSDFTYTEDELMECVCRDCGWTTEDEECLVCPKCNGEDIISYSYNEGHICDICKHKFDIWEDCYTHISPISVINMICQDCYDKLEED